MSAARDAAPGKRKAREGEVRRALVSISVRSRSLPEALPGAPKLRAEGVPSPALHGAASRAEPPHTCSLAAVTHAAALTPTIPANANRSMGLRVRRGRARAAADTSAAVP